jgi:hypothetical protein
MIKAYLNPVTGQVEYTAIGSSIKADNGNRVSGYLVRFTDANDVDLHGEFFDADTNFWLREHSPIGKPIMIDHAFDPKFKSVPVGIIDFAKQDEIGIWIEGKLKDRQEYEDMLRGWKDRKYIDIDDDIITKAASGIQQAVKTFFSTGKAQWSSGALPQSVEIDSDTGHIKSWAFIEGTGVYTPAEPDGTEIKLKSVFSTLNEILQSHQLSDSDGRKEANGLTGASATVNEAAQPNGAQQPIDSKLTPEKDTKMDEEMIRQIVRIVLEEAAAGMPDKEMPEEEEVVASVTPDIEKAKAEGEEDEEELAKAVATRAWAEINKKLATREKALSAARGVSKQNLANLAAQPATQQLPAFSSGSNGNKANTRKWGQLTVNEMREYADMSAEEMALVAKLAKSAVSPYDRKGLTMGSFVERGILSESFVKTFAHKAAAKLSTWQIKNDQDLIALNDYATMKTFNWLKADELGATDITGQGAEWSELFYDTQAWRRVREETPLYDTLVSKGMRVKDIPTGTKGMNVKLVDGAGVAYTLQEGGSVDASGRPEVVSNPSFITTNEKEANLATHIIAEGFTFQLAERSMINVAQELNEDIITTLAESLENTILNGDTRTATNTNINLIDGTPGTGLSTPDYIAWNGIRYEVLITNTANGIDNAGVALAAVDYERVRAKFPLRFRRRKDNILFIIDEGVETQTRRLAEHFTVGIAGENAATFFTGDLNVLVGYDVYASGFLGLSNGDGKISATGSNNVKGQIYGVFAPYLQYGRQLAINIEEDRFALSQSSVFVATVNHLLMPRSAYAAVGMYDIAVA